MAPRKSIDYIPPEISVNDHHDSDVSCRYLKFLFNLFVIFKY